MRAIWLTDIFDPALRSSTKAASLPGVALRSMGWSKADETIITYLALHSEPNLYLAYDVPKKDRFSKYPETLLKKHVLRLDTRSLKVRSKLITEDSHSLRSGVEEVIAFVKRQKVDLVTLQTHSRKGFERFLVGSFAETMMLMSPISLLLLNPDVRVSKRVKQILLAVDIDKSAEVSVKHATKLARYAGATLRLLHIARPSYSANFHGQDKDVFSYRKNIDRRIQDLVAIAEAGGVDCTAIIRDDLSPTTDVILDEAKSSKADVIAVHAKSGPLRRLILGSVARHVVRAANVPVLVLRQ
jgi:nucleotide-binding universal stress UspA family protein